MASVTENPIILDIQNTYGALLIGCFLSCIMWGITSLQLFWYFYHNDSDSALRKSFVFFLWIADTINEILILKPMWPVLILQWGRVAGLSDIQSEMTHHIWVSGIVAISVQYYYLYRIYIYSGKKWITPAFIAFIALWQIVETIPYQIVLHKDYTFSTLASTTITGFNVSLRASSAAVDIFIALTMSYYMWKQGRPQFPRTKQMYFRLLILTINTGAWTALFATLDFCLMAAYKDDLWYTMFEWPLCSLYLSVLLVNLNTREYVRGKATTQIWQGSTQVPGPFDYHANSSGTVVPRKDAIMMINIETERTTREEYKSGLSSQV